MDQYDENWNWQDTPLTGLFNYKNYDIDATTELFSTSESLSLNDSETLTDWQEVPASELGISETILTDSHITLQAHYDSDNNIDKLSVVYSPTTEFGEVIQYLITARNDIAENITSPLESIKEYAESLNLTGEDVIVTGYSVGGTYANIMAENAETIADGFFNNSDYIAYNSLYIYENSDLIYNVGYEDSQFYGVQNQENQYMDNIYQEFSNSSDNIVLFDDTYASNPQPYIITDFSKFWDTSIIEITTESSYYSLMNQDSVVIIDDLSSDNQADTWVGDYAHTDSAAFVIGTDNNDLLFGNDKGDYIDAGAGDDSIRTGSGADRVDGGEGSDTVWVEGTADDWNIYQLDETTYFISNLDGSNLKHLENVESVYFIGGDETVNLSEVTLSDSTNAHQDADHPWFNYDAYLGEIWGNIIEDNVILASGFQSTYGQYMYDYEMYPPNDSRYLMDAETLAHGSSHNDIISGSGALYGAEGNDGIFIHEGTQLATGGIGSDTFFFVDNALSVTITDFNDYGDNDVLLFDTSDIEFESQFDSLDDIKDHTTQVGDDVVISDGAEYNITIQSVQLDTVLSQMIDEAPYDL